MQWPCSAPINAGEQHFLLPYNIYYPITDNYSGGLWFKMHWILLFFFGGCVSGYNNSEPQRCTGETQGIHEYMKCGHDMTEIMSKVTYNTVQSINVHLLKIQQRDTGSS